MVLDNIREAIKEWLLTHNLTMPPLGPIFLMIVSLSVSTLSGLVTKTLLNMDELAKQNEKIQAHERRKKKARETADKKLWQSVQKRDQQMTELRNSMMMKRMLPSLITMGPMIFVFSTLRLAFQSTLNLGLNGWVNLDDNGSITSSSTCENSCGGVAVLPFHVPSWFPIIGKWFSPYATDGVLAIAGFGFFYFLTAISSSQILMKVFGVNLTGQQSSGFPTR